MSDIFIMAGARTAIGTFGGGLSSKTPTELGAAAAAEAIRRAGIEPADVDNSVFGTVIPTEAADLFLGRTVALAAGMPIETQGLTLNRLCGSGAQAIVTAAQMIKLGESKIAIAGGAEAMSRSPYSIDGMRYGKRMGNGQVYDWLTNTLADPFGHGAMGDTAENVAEKYQITRERQDAFALESQRRARVAIEEGRFKEQIVAVAVKTRKGTVDFDTDEHPRATSAEALAALKPSFRQNGTVTPGNASGINDGGAAIVLAGEAEVVRRDLKPIGRLLGWGVAGVPPEIMGIGPVKAVPIALERAGLNLSDIDIFESNEAFAAQAIAVNDGLGLSTDKVNPNGGAVALGHPLGATGAILTVKALYELRRIGGRYGVVTMCIGGGQGIALVLEHLQ
ncbi:beta-ketothiolase BktB [Sinorhizobium meliloti]|uniref:beta-ketothiolase BktB n=1 Tax=Rhizobium meliloti TaxID=382 RepID=UPI000FD58AE9|nr:beta-ketothiolase BktB [Sinorhizobium meliloti]MQV24877.1 acetyl-CoA C-acyltransferase [Sinorhizobium meliloti]MQV37453.1 acetyl-CoA C-acyltransferase [Sinorhizobium meliloti]RVE79241.1 acetyl-CoA C-acyltransferase [Sinorhizobium meliloti]RVG42685.1 acetyl-CoA C-acyltransferase [Sinorhizobium meliloti]RVM08279.1 acetyl-CoA C-acyltransferase [Sinorhizobium meliloti]